MENEKSVLTGTLDELDDAERMLAILLFVSIFDDTIIKNLKNNITKSPTE